MTPLRMVYRLTKSTSAARKFLRRRKFALGESRSHLIETTLAGSGILRHMEAAQSEGYWIVLHYISLDSPDQALDRIRSRVALGGHDVPPTDVQRRFLRSYSNPSAAISLADEVLLYDNSSPDQPHRKVAVFKGGTWQLVEDIPVWAVPFC